MTASTRLVLPSPFFSTLVRSISVESLRRTGVRLLSALAPDSAVTTAERLFSSTLRPARSDADWQALDEAQHFVLPFASGRLAAWRWGPADAPTVVLMHGWGGHAAQLRAFVAPLRAAGRTVVAFDAPGHGLSEGSHSTFIHFALALEEVLRHVGPASGVIAHSMGGAVTAYAMSRGAPVPRTVLVAPPASLTEYSRRFADALGLPESLRHSMQRRIEHRYGVRWNDMEVERLLPRIDRPALVIHDTGDREVPIAHGERYAAHWPGARLLRTAGLGHRRILADPQVVAAAVAFIGHDPGDAA